jgi:hypothetical protein
MREADGCQWHHMRSEQCTAWGRRQAMQCATLLATHALLMVSHLYGLLAPHPDCIMQGCEASSVLHIHKARLSCIGEAIGPALSRGAAVVPADTQKAYRWVCGVQLNGS